MWGGPVQRIRDVFGWPGFPHALFYQVDYGLRFELSGEVGSAPLRLMRAMDRARAVVDAAFAGSSALTAVIEHHEGERRSRRGSAIVKQLAEIGFKSAFAGPERVAQHDQDYIADFGGDLYRYWYAADFEKTGEALTALLWAAVSRELGVRPKARWLSGVYIVDFARGIVAHPYDDRGMDVVALRRDDLEALYARFGSWLLDYDRATMDAMFRSPGP